MREKHDGGRRIGLPRCESGGRGRPPHKFSGNSGGAMNAVREKQIF